MGNTLSPRSAEFAAEFRRLEAAIAAEEAQPTLERNAAALRLLNLELLRYKICSAEYWCRIAHNLAKTHEIAPKRCYCCEVHPGGGCCPGVRGAHTSSAVWRLSQEAFYRQLLAALEEEKAAWQQRLPVTAAPLPALPVVPVAEWILPEGIPSCPSCISFLKEFNKEEPLLRHKQEIYCSQGWPPPHAGSPCRCDAMGPGTPSARSDTMGHSGTGEATQASRPVPAGTARMADEVRAAGGQGGRQGPTASAGTTGRVLNAESEYVAAMREASNPAHLHMATVRRRHNPGHSP